VCICAGKASTGFAFIKRAGKHEEITNGVVEFFFYNLLNLS
jgi:hypothetical protein